MTTTTTFVWDPVSDCVISELDGTNAVQAVYTNEPQQYGGVISQHRDTLTSTLHSDALGTTRLLTDSTQTTTDTYLYDAWGNLVASSGTTVNPFRWVGRYGYYLDSSTGLVYVRARMYMPTGARWMSQDPLMFADEINRYSYGHRHPAAVTDPSGLVCQTPKCPSSSVWKPSDCASSPGTDGVDCPCDATDNPPIGPGFPLPELGNEIRRGGDIPGIPKTCSVRYVIGNTGVGKPNVGRACARKNTKGEIEVLIVLEPGTSLCTARELLAHELVHARQYCRKGISQNGNSPAGGDCESNERAAYKSSCAARADQLCYKDGSERDAYISDCIERGIALSCETLPAEIDKNKGPNCSDIFTANGL